MHFNSIKSIVLICLLAILNACGIGRYHSLNLVKGDNIAINVKEKTSKKIIAQREEISLDNSVALKAIVTKMDLLNNEDFSDSKTLKPSFINNSFVKRTKHDLKEKQTELSSKKYIPVGKYLPIKVKNILSINWLFLVLSIIGLIILCAYLYFAIPFLIYWGILGIIAAIPAILVLVLLIKIIRLI